MLSALVLCLTLIIEVGKIGHGLRTKKKHIEHFCEVLVNACCKKHRRCLVYFSGICLVPLTQTVYAVIYEFWLKSFVKYWTEKSQYWGSFELQTNVKCKCSKR